MKLFLNTWFDSAVMSGEIVASLLLTLLILMIRHNYRTKPQTQILLIGSAFMTAVFVGQGVANALKPSAPIFGFLPAIILSAIFFQTYKLVAIVVAAQLIGAMVAIVIFRIYKYVFKDQRPVATPPVLLRQTQLMTKEIIAQIIYCLVLLYIGYATFNNGASIVNISPLISSALILVAITGLLMIFAHHNGFMISPILTIAIACGEGNWSKIAWQLFWQRNWKTITTQTTIQAVAVVGVGFGAWGSKWW